MDDQAALERARHAARLELVVLRCGETIELRVALDPRLANEPPAPPPGDHHRLMRSHALDTSAPFVERELF
jgi:hypothetical protein